MPDQPFTEEELVIVAQFANLNVAQVRGIAWLTTMKLRNVSERRPRSE